MGQTVNLLVFTFGGSNPSSPTTSAEVAQSIEHQPSKLRVAGLSPVFRSKQLLKVCQCSSGVEHFLGKEEVAGSNPAIGSKTKATVRPPDGSTAPNPRWCVTHLRAVGALIVKKLTIITNKNQFL